MPFDEIYFRRHRCFNTEWAGFQTIKPINVIIGRNNSGKSSLLDLIADVCGQRTRTSGRQYLCSGVFDEASLKEAFSPSTRSSVLPGDYWSQNGKELVGKRIRWVSESGRPSVPEFEPGFDLGLGLRELSYNLESKMRAIEERTKLLVVCLQGQEHLLGGKIFRLLSAERDIRPEFADHGLGLSPQGDGASRIVYRYLMSSGHKYRRELIQESVLEGLNRVFGQDATFTEIEVQAHDESNPERPHWEIYLAEKNKGLVPLSQSGSGLKTVILVLLNLIVVPHLEQKDASDYVYAFEELENNLHPSLFRRLLHFITERIESKGGHAFLTTHSSVAVDYFAQSSNAQIVHVAHDGQTARARSVSVHFDRSAVLADLGARPSDLLQANGVIWVEGPSDRIYLNRWIEIFSEGELREGRQYQCAFFGGALLARTEFRDPELGSKDLVNLLQLNSNLVVVCDSDRNSRNAEPKARVSRISSEVATIPGGHCWITDAKEIENYIPGLVLEECFDQKGLPDPLQFEAFFPGQKAREKSYLSSKLGRRSIDKVELALQVAPRMTAQLMANRFDWSAQMNKIVDMIKRWNS